MPEDVNFALFNQQRTEVALKVELFVSDRSIGMLYNMYVYADHSGMYI